jgi:beta-xylosidase
VALLVPLTAPASAAPEATGTYVNPISRDFADTFADPAVIRGKDGFWYSYGTSDPLREGDNEFHRIPIARSTNLVDWDYVGDAFTTETLPTWADQARRASIWAPDIRYVNGQYRMYYVVTETTVTPEPNDNAVGMATAPTPAGPWTDSGAPVVGPRRGSGEPGNFLWTFDPSAVTDTDGTQWLLYGSYFGGVFITRLNDAGTRAEGTPTQVAIDNKFEGAYVVRRGSYWYLFASTANCCAGPTTGYSVHVGRSRDLRGPYLDREGVPLTVSRAGGTPTLVQNGNRWIGAGHNAVVTDLAGQDWIVYHAIRRGNPYLTGTEGINERPMLIDRLDWIAGWPQVRAGAGPSSTRERAPVTGGTWFTRFTAGIPRAFVARGSWSSRVHQQSGRYVTSKHSGSVLTRSRSTGDVRVEADVRSAGADFGLVAGARPGRTGTRVVVDNDAHQLRLEEVRSGRIVARATADIPANFVPGAWHSLSLQILGKTARAELSHARLGDPLAKVALRLSRFSARTGRAGFLSGGRASVDNLSVLGAYRPVRAVVTEPVASQLDPAASDEFAGPGVGAGWSWVRQDPNATVADGVLRWPTQNADLVGCGRNSDLNANGQPDNDPKCDSNNASVLLRNPGSGNWTVETKLTIDLGTETIRNFQQGGLIAYVNDDNFARLSHVAIWNTRQTEYGRELPYFGRTSYGGTIVGPPDATMWLRLTHRLDANGEHELRAWSRRAGGSWVKGGVWTLPAGADVRVGLVSHGGAGATAMFDYFRIYR